jgi:Leucine-rich repeat (LRR) protein
VDLYQKIFDLDRNQYRTLNSDQIKTCYYKFENKTMYLLPRLLEAIRNVSHLEELSLSFNGCNEFTDNDLRMLAEAIQHFKNLTSLSLNTYDCN